MATYPIRQLADNGGTAQFVPVTAPEAVQFPDGSNLNTFIGSVATIESNPVAANHAVGEFLCINGQVYEVIDAITAGDSISLGENVQVTNLGSRITALNNGLIWKPLASGVSSAVTTSLANIDYKELLLVARYSNAAYSVIALKTEIDAGQTIWSSGVFFRTGTWVGAQFGYDASAKTIRLSYFNNSGTDVLASSTYSVYYR